MTAKRTNSSSLFLVDCTPDVNAIVRQLGGEPIHSEQKLRDGGYPTAQGVILRKVGL